MWNICFMFLSEIKCPAALLNKAETNKLLSFYHCLSVQALLHFPFCLISKEKCPLFRTTSIILRQCLSSGGRRRCDYHSVSSGRVQRMLTVAHLCGDSGWNQSVFLILYLNYCIMSWYAYSTVGLTFIYHQYQWKTDITIKLASVW